MTFLPPNPTEDQSLDPKDWEAMRSLGHQMVDDLIDYWAGIREQKIWRPIPDEVKQVEHQHRERRKKQSCVGVRRFATLEIPNTA